MQYSQTAPRCIILTAIDRNPLPELNCDRFGERVSVNRRKREFSHRLKKRLIRVRRVLLEENQSNRFQGFFSGILQRVTLTVVDECNVSGTDRD